MAKEDDNFITKHAARFNLNPSERIHLKNKYLLLLSKQILLIYCFLVSFSF